MFLWFRVFSVSQQILAKVVTAAIGWSPILVSSRRVRASTPSETALATSMTSALVGYLSLIIELSMEVQVMIGLAAKLALSTIHF